MLAFRVRARIRHKRLGYGLGLGSGLGFRDRVGLGSGVEFSVTARVLGRQSQGRGWVWGSGFRVWVRARVSVFQVSALGLVLGFRA